MSSALQVRGVAGTIYPVPDIEHVDRHLIVLAHRARHGWDMEHVKKRYRADIDLLLDARLDLATAFTPG